MQQTARRYHDFSYGHKVYGHENKCAHLHGHNGRITFIVTSGTLDEVGRIIDFAEIGRCLCQWLETNWDHRFLVSDIDPDRHSLAGIDPEGVVIVPFNPTAENMAKYLVLVIAPRELKSTGVTLVECCVEETRKCSASYSLNNWNTFDMKVPTLLVEKA